TFFYHQKRLAAPDKHAGLKQAIRDSLQRNKHRYGYRRALLDHRKQGRLGKPTRVSQLTNPRGPKSKGRVKKYNSYKGAASHIATNVLDRCFTPEAQNRVWASDVTEFRVAGTKVYLSPIMDLYDRSVVSYSVSTSPSTALTSQSLRN